MNKNVFLICGVSGSGKTWLCKQLTDKYHYIPHDEHYNAHVDFISKNLHSNKPVITECPFGERLIRQELEKLGLMVHPFFIIISPSKIAMQYLAREGKAAPKNVITRATTILNRAKEWEAPFGKAEEILDFLKAMDHPAKR